MYEKMIVAFDGSVPAARALQHAIQLAQTVHAKLVTILHVNPNLPLGEPLLNIDLDSLVEEENEALLMPALRQLAHSGISYESHSLDGDPAAVITTYADEHRADVILMGSTGKSMIKEALLGSVSHEVAHTAHCPVIIVK
ncbi:universal stress protein family [Fictibacillus macauensis ZFHKF-1]|uniref:Universal stress protein family n=1 Tax=Fictibacillus macauensis ZFHKF-1 TaxID=1196324 RepID=I8AJH6_9BACL|nr:universal stress protein [Fictibacillus macauensis]EIT85669.1 universal stress protein family [Fictibacillus macauensis ZFHKF-1]